MQRKNIISLISIGILASLSSVALVGIGVAQAKEPPCDKVHPPVHPIPHLDHRVPPQHSCEKAHMYALVLSPKYPDLLVWKWNHPDPYRWNVYISLDGGKTYFLIEDYWAYGNKRQFAPDGGSEWMYIVGVDQSGKEVTKHSNAVRPDDAPVPKS